MMAWLRNDDFIKLQNKIIKVISVVVIKGVLVKRLF